MKLILAQGNPDSEYAKSRHNISWQVVDAYFTKNDISEPKLKTKFSAYITETLIDGEKVIFAKPTTYYNETGKSARAICDFYNISPDNVLVIHDDLSLPFGSIRIRQSGSDAGNNGIKSLNSHLGQNYWRLKIGILNELREKMPDANFVLGSFSKKEQQFIADQIVPKSSQIIDQFIVGKIEVTSISLS